MNGYEPLAKFITTVGIIPGILIWVLWEVRAYMHAQIELLKAINDALQLLIKLH